jgi:tetrahydromethanopterin S-methyltransferase subunit G
MGAIEDTRKVLQDFLAPEMREIKARLDALEKRFDVVDRKFDGIDRKFDGIDRKFDGIDRRFDDMELRAEKRHDAVMQALTDYTDVRIRLARLESKEAAHQ